MKRRFLITLLSCLALSFSAFAFAACDNTSESTADNAQNSSVTESSSDGQSSSNEEGGSVVIGTEGLHYQRIPGKDEYRLFDLGVASELDIVIASVHNGMPVTEIANNAFGRNGCENLTSVTIPDTVTHIGQSAFSNCANLKSLELPDSVETIDSYALYGCKNLTGIKIPASVTTLGMEALPALRTMIVYCESKAAPEGWAWDSGSIPVVWDCNNNEIANDGYVYRDIQGSRYAIKENATAFSVQLDNTLTKVEILEQITYQNKSYPVIKIKDYAFSDASAATEISIPDSMEIIEEYALKSCKHLQYNMEGELQYLGNNSNPYLYLAGRTVEDMVSVTINANCKIIGAEVFSRCNSLINIEIPNGVKSIGKGVFRNCYNLTSVIIPDSVTSIGEGVFAYCSNLKYNEKEGLKYLGNSSNLYVYLVETIDKSIETAIIDNNCRVVGDGAFYDCNNLTDVEIPNSVTSIGKQAFGSCDSLTSVEIPDGVTSIGNSAFWNCTNLTSVVISDSVTSVAERAFYNCTSLTSIIFNGTKTQWNAMGKGFYWNDSVPATEVVCTDGTVGL